MIHFEIPKNQSSIIKVIGVGGGGGNAINYMYKLGIEGVDFVVCNTDSQALALSPIPNKIQLGPHLTQGLGAGANPDVGRQAGEESVEEIRKILEVNTKMVFITAGMGGGTGTGAAPIIAKVCKELGILTVGIVTTPFPYEGRKRIQQATDGIESLKENVDTLLIISNDKLRQQFGNLPYSEAFSRADNILATAAKCITDLITKDGKVNLDFNDVQTVMRNGGRAILGSALAAGENRAMKAVEEALNSPLLNDSNIEGAKWILLNITSARGEFQHSLDELEVIQAFVQQQAGHNCDIILGMGDDDSLGEQIAVSIIATGFNFTNVAESFPEQKTEVVEKILVPLNAADAKEKVQEKKVEKPQELDPFAPILVDVNIKKEVENPNLKVISSDGFIMENIPAYKPNQANEGEELFQVKTEEKIVLGEVAVDMTQLQNEIENEIHNKEEQERKAFEERAERLRQMTMEVAGTDNHKEIEEIPAYIRKNVNIEEESKSNSLSGYGVENNANKKSGFFNTINAFLKGDKPD